MERVHARKIVLATGFEGNGGWRAPLDLVAGLPAALYAHSTDDIDFERLAGKRVGVLGVGASAFDNAAAALEAGAATVDLCFRRAHMPRINPLLWTHFAGMLGHFAELTELERWRFMRRILEELPQPPPQDAFWRCRRFDNFDWHADCPWHAVRDAGGVAAVEAKARTFEFDFVIFATGAATDISARSELAGMVGKIALWRDRFTPPPGEESDLLAAYPYLGPAFEFIEREPGTAPFLRRLHDFTFGATTSLGLSGAAIPGIKYGVRRLVSGLVQDLFREDAASYYRDLLAFAVPELQILESAYAWAAGLGADALDELKLDGAMLAAMQGDVASPSRGFESDKSGSKRIRPKRVPGSGRAKSASGRSAQQRRRAN
jgi:cation diffusion facilitator CzcD-associated flavoprotein CzcO